MNIIDAINNGLGNIIEPIGIKPLTFNPNIGSSLPPKPNGSTNTTAPPKPSSSNTGVFKNISDLLTDGLTVYSNISMSKIQNEQAQLNLQAEALKQQRDFNSSGSGLDCKNPVLNEETGQMECKSNNTILYVAGGVLLLGAIGTATYFMLKK